LQSLGKFLTQLLLLCDCKAVEVEEGRPCNAWGMRALANANTSNLAKSVLALAALLTTSFQVEPASAENYSVNLTRKGSNVYKIDGKDVIVQTRYCYVYAYSEDAILKSSGYGGEVIFLDSDDECDVKAVFGKSAQTSGNYVVTVSREGDDWYEVFGTDFFIKTSTCFSFAFGEEAYLTISASGFGQLQFRDGDNWVVEGVYSKLRL
jgi:hypothetical protein